MKILIHDDGKDRTHSFEAYLRDLYILQALGETEEEVIEDLKIQVNTLITKLQNLDYSDVEYVDCLGQPLKKGSKGA